MGLFENWTQEAPLEGFQVDVTGFLKALEWQRNGEAKGCWNPPFGT